MGQQQASSGADCIESKIRIGTVSKCCITITMILSLLCLGGSLYGVRKYMVLRSSMQEYVTCESAIRRFSRASDTLTRQARLAASTGDTKYIDAYFREAEDDRNREAAIEEISSFEGNADTIAALNDAMQDSERLMETEYYVMCLVQEAGKTNRDSWPRALQSIILSRDDQGLSGKEKLIRAQDLMSSPEYELAKEKISEGVEKAIESLSRQMGSRQNRAADIFSDVYRKVLFSVAAFAALLLVTYFILHYWIAYPLVKYNESILRGTTFPVCGVYELQLLAKTYNKVFLENEEREKLLLHQVEHDPLTGALNRGAFERILTMLEGGKRAFALILIDVDNFKSINDTYGHAAGDIVLSRVTRLLSGEFRNVDHVCRIGGDEFAVIMMDVTGSVGENIEGKIAGINRRLAIPEWDAPAVSLSVGVAFTDREKPGESIYKDADHALYYVKEHGRSGCHIYSASDAHPVI